MADSKPKLVDLDTASTTATPPDPFDLSTLRLNPSFLETAGVKKLTTTVPVRKPGKQDFIRVRPEPEYRENFAMIDLKDERISCDRRSCRSWRGKSSSRRCSPRSTARG
jgi:hypothetical protein